MEQAGLTVLRGPVDRLRQDNVSLELAHGPAHPVQLIQNTVQKEWNRNLDSVRRTYGSHLAMRLATEKKFFARAHRLPGLESNHIALQTLSGTDESIDFADYLNGKQTSI